jgi:hypothetical protein
LGLFTLVPDRRSAHALLNASEARFVHTFGVLAAAVADPRVFMHLPR